MQSVLQQACHLSRQPENERDHPRDVLSAKDELINKLGGQMNSRILPALAFAVAVGAAHAADITTPTTYFGLTQGVASGFFGHVGVGLPVGQTCKGQRFVILLTTNPRYKEILATLLLAEASKQPVKFARLASSLATFGANAFCEITEAAIGDFPAW